MQAQNRVGSNELSNGAATPTDNGAFLSWSAGQKIVIIFGTNAWLAGEDIYEFTVSGSAANDPTTAQVLASVRTRGTAVIGIQNYPGVGANLSLPLELELTEDDHVALGAIASTTAALPSNPIYGMVRYVQDQAAYWKFDNLAESGLFAANGGYWISHLTGFSRYLADTSQEAIADTQIQGYARPISQIATGIQSDVVIDIAPYLFDGTLQEANFSPIFAIAVPNGDSPLDANTNIEVRFYAGGDNVSVAFSGRAIVTLLGKVNLSTGTLDTTANEVGTPQIIGPTITDGVGGVITSEQLDDGFAWVYRIQLQAFAAEISSPDSPIIQGDRLTYYPKVEGALGEPAPYAALLGQGVANVGDRMVVLPSVGTGKATVGSGSLLSLDETTNRGIFTPFSGQRDVLGLLANTEGQVVAVNAPFNSVVVRGSNSELKPYEEKRGEVGTGLGPASGRYTASDWSSPVTIAGSTETLQVVVNHPTTIRSDYPDTQISGKTAPYNALNIIVFVRFGGTIYEAIATTVLGSPQTINITDLGSTVVSSLPDSSSDQSFGLFDYGAIAPSAITAGSSLAAGNYEVAIVHEYNGSQVTRISHDTGNGSIRVISQTTQAAYLNEAQTFTAAQRSQPVALSISSGTVTIDCNASNTYTLALTANVTSVVLSNLTAGTNFDLAIAQSGGFTMAGWPASIRWVNGNIAPTISPTANAVDVLMFKSFDGTTLRGAIAPN